MRRLRQPTVNAHDALHRAVANYRLQPHEMISNKTRKNFIVIDQPASVRRKYPEKACSHCNDTALNAVAPTD